MALDDLFFPLGLIFWQTLLSLEKILCCFISMGIIIPHLSHHGRTAGFLWWRMIGWLSVSSHSLFRSSAIFLKLFSPVLRIRDAYPGFEFFLSWIPHPNFFHPGSASKNGCILNQKIVALLSEKLFMLFIPDPNPDFLPIPDLGSRDQKSTRSRILIRNNTWVYKRYGVPGSWYIPVTSSIY